MNRLSLALAGAVFSLFAAQSMAGDAAAGKAVWDKINCASCHGPDAKTPIDPAYPILAGQHGDYIVHALTAYQRGAAGAPASANVRKNAVMGAFAPQLSAQDVENVAAWLSTQPGPLKVAH